MSFVLLKNYDHYLIANDDADFLVGRVDPLNGRLGPYKVTVHVGPMDRKSNEAGTVNSLKEAIPAFLAYYERHPLHWERLNKAYIKFTLFVILEVTQDQQGNWLASRDNFPLLRHGRPAHFATWADAQRAADAHELDSFPNAKTIDDGLSWVPDPEINWRSVPHLVEERASWQRSASGWLP